MKWPPSASTISIGMRVGCLYALAKPIRRGYSLLVQDVGQAVAAYLHRGRPATTSRHVFLACRAPFQPLTDATAISRIATRALRRAGVTGHLRLGAHTFRHTAASQMVNRGASFKEVADVLGHRSLQTTGIYAKLDLDTLVAVALPWMGDSL